MTRITAEAQDQFDALPLPIRDRVLPIFERLCDWPNVSGAKPLRGSLVGRYRIRTGAYRVQFHIDSSGDPTVEKIAKRDRFYDD